MKIIKRFYYLYIIFFILSLCGCGNDLASAIFDKFPPEVTPDPSGGGSSAEGSYTVSSYSVGGIVYDSQKNVIAIVAGHEVDNTWFAVGVKRSSSSMAWLDSKATSSSLSITDIKAHVSKNGSYSGKTDGSSNWNAVYKADKTNADKGYYKAFNWANTYSNSYVQTVTGWYLPSLYEYYIMWKNMSTIDNALKNAKGDVLSGYKYWSSSQDSERISTDAGDFSFWSSSIDEDMSSSKIGEYSYCRAIIKLANQSSNTTTTTTTTTTNTKYWYVINFPDTDTNSFIKLTFNATKGSTYKIYMDDKSGSGNYKFDAYISGGYKTNNSAYYMEYFYQSDYCYFSPKTIQSTESNVCLLITPSQSDASGTNKGTCAVAVTDENGNNITTLSNDSSRKAYIQSNILR